MYGSFSLTHFINSLVYFCCLVIYLILSIKKLVNQNV